MNKIDNDAISELYESLNNLMLKNPELYLKLAQDELKDKIKSKIINVDIKYIVKSDFVYIDISSPSTKNIINLGTLYKLVIKIGFTEEMLKPQIKVNNEYRQVKNLDELNTSELTISFDNFYEKEIKLEDNISIIEVEAVLHKIVFEKIKKEEIFKYYVISIIHDRILLKLRNQTNFTDSETIIEKILSQGKVFKIIPKYGVVDNIGFSKNNMNITDLEFCKIKKFIKHTLSLTCYISYEDIFIEDNIQSINKETTVNIVEEIETPEKKEINKLPSIWKELVQLDGIKIQKGYLPIYFKAAVKQNDLILQFKFKGPKNIIDNLDKADARVSKNSLRVTYDSIIVLYLNLNNFITTYHNCSLCDPILNYKKSILICNKNYLKAFLPVENICDILKYNLK